jgi:bifunctional non-homologous end joining protein LigD
VTEPRVLKAPGASEIEVSRPDKLLWPGLGITKRAYVDYLIAVSDHMLPWVRRRPMTVIRAPDGVDGERYYQKAAPKYAPEWIDRIRLPAPSAKRDVDYPICDDAAALAWFGNQAALEFHPAPVRVDRVERPDLLVVDVDPPEGEFSAAVEVVTLVVEVLDDLGLSTGAKTTGGKGLHVVVPIERRYRPSQLRTAAAALTAIVAARRPELVTDAFRKAERGGRVMLDPSRNGGANATIVAPYSPRIRPEGTVSFPIAPEELATAAPEHYTLATAVGLLEGAGPQRWIGLAEERQRLPASLLRGG